MASTAHQGVRIKPLCSTDVLCVTQLIKASVRAILLATCLYGYPVRSAHRWYFQLHSFQLSPPTPDRLLRRRRHPSVPAAVGGTVGAAGGGPRQCSAGVGRGVMPAARGLHPARWPPPPLWSPLLLLLTLGSLVRTGGAGNPDAKRLYDDLLSNYNKLVRPVVNVTDPLTVKIKLKLSQLIDVVSHLEIL